MSIEEIDIDISAIHRDISHKSILNEYTPTNTIQHNHKKEEMNRF